jgi:hypothetical protein
LGEVNRYVDPRLRLGDERLHACHSRPGEEADTFDTFVFRRAGAPDVRFFLVSITPRTFFLASHLISSHIISHVYLPCISHTHTMHIVAGTERGQSTYIISNTQTH